MMDDGRLEIQGGTTLGFHIAPSRTLGVLLAGKGPLLGIPHEDRRRSLIPYPDGPWDLDGTPWRSQT